MKEKDITAICDDIYSKRGIMKYYGVNEIDKYLYENYLKYLEKDSPSYIECGAVDGKQQSNTAILDFHYGWHGILIEANPHLYGRLAQNRKNVFTANCALVSHDYTGEYIEGFFNNKVPSARPNPNSQEYDWLVYKNHKSDKEYQNAMSGQIKTNHNYNKERFSDDTALLEVPAKTLDSLFKESGLNEADFFSLDVEEYEEEALKGWSPSKYPISYVLVETTEDSGATKYMKSHDYRIIDEIDSNILFQFNELKTFWK